MGILQNRLAPENVDRSKFVMTRPPSAGKPKKKITTVVDSPAGVEKNTAEYWQKKFESAQGIIAAQADSAVAPEEAGILVVPKPVVTRTCRAVLFS